MQLLQLHEPGETPLPHDDTVAVGIDLGTTYSVVAVAREDGVDVLHNIHGHALVPSVVHYGEEIEVGYSALKKYHAGEKNTYASIKRIMGRGVDDKLAVAVSSEILKHLKKNAENALGKEVTKAVITVPAYFDDAARQATKDAAQLAGLEVLRLVNEPTAAALAYGLDTGAEGIYAIYDLGGGTFDVSLLKLQQGVFQVLATGGDTQLGGDDFDQLIVAWLIAECGLTNLSKEQLAVLSGFAREAKHALTEQDSVALPSPTFSPHHHNDPHPNPLPEGEGIVLTRDIFEELILDTVEKTISVCEQAISDANLTLADIRGVVMVGGSTRVPLVVEKVREFFGREPLTDLNPDEVVAMGAAIQAHGLTQGSNTLLLDVLPLSLGLETMGGIVEKILHRNTPIPAVVTQEFTTYQDGQTAMMIHVLQGEREMVTDCRSLARFELTGIPPMVAGIARIRITFSVDADGLLTVSAEEATTRTQQKIEVKPAYGLTPQEVERMLTESMQYAREDITARLLAESKVEAQRSISEILSALQTDSSLLGTAELAHIHAHIDQTKAALAGEDRDLIDYTVQALHQVTRIFAEKRMDNAITRALKGAHISSYSPGDNENA